MLDFNRENVSATDINTQVNAALDASALAEQAEQRERRGPRLANLGASGIGSECLRQVQFDWKFDVDFTARRRRIFSRGFAFEDIVAAELGRAGFRIERGTDRLKFESANGKFKGKGDGIVLDGPVIPGLLFPCVWECKAVQSSGWKKLARDGLKKAYPNYYDQVQLYQAYLDLTNPALFTAINSDNCEALHLSVEFDAEAAQRASDRAAMVVKATLAGELLDRIAKKPDDFRCKICSHRVRCWELPNQ